MPTKTKEPQEKTSGNGTGGDSAEGRGPARSIWKGAISFGMVAIPVKLFPATGSKDIAVKEKQGEANAFQDVAKRESKDTASAGMGGELRFLSREELTRAYGKELADAVFSLKMPGEKAGPIETANGVELVKMQMKTAAANHSFEESKDAIRQRIAREELLAPHRHLVGSDFRGRDYELFRLGDSIGERRARHTELAHADVQPLQRMGVVGR